MTQLKLLRKGLPLEARRGAVMTIETLVKLGVVAVGAAIVFIIFRQVRGVQSSFQQALSDAPWHNMPGGGGGGGSGGGGGTP